MTGWDWEPKPGAEVEISWYPEDGEAFEPGMLDDAAGTLTTFRYEQEGRKADYPARILTARVAEDGLSATAMLRLESAEVTDSDR